MNQAEISVKLDRKRDVCDFFLNWTGSVTSVIFVKLDRKCDVRDFLNYRRLYLPEAMA